MKGEEKRFYETDTSYISVMDDSIQIKKKDGKKKTFGTIEICSGFSIELGRTVQQFQEVLWGETELPLVILHPRDRSGEDWIRNGYYICFIDTMYLGEAEDVTLAYLECRKEAEDKVIICRVTCSRKYLDYGNELRFGKIGSLWELKIPYTEDLEENKKQVQKVVEDFIGASEDENFVINATYDKYTIFINVKNEEMACTYTFILDESVNAYIFSRIGLDE